MRRLCVYALPCSGLCILRAALQWYYTYVQCVEVLSPPCGTPLALVVACTAQCDCKQCEALRQRLQSCVWL